MVAPNQYLERMVVFPGPEGTFLEGLYHRGKDQPFPAVISAPHPHMGGSMLSPVVAELAFAFFNKGFQTLRYNYRGVGASQGALADMAGVEEASMADLRTAMDHATGGPETEDGAPTRVLLVGYSFGAMVSLRMALENPDRVWKLILVAPPTRMMALAPIKSLEVPLMALAGSKDDFCDIPQLNQWAAQSPEMAKVNLIIGANHFFATGLTELGRLAAEFA